jgi:hypothetical protein
MICFTLYSVKLSFRGKQRNNFKFKVSSQFDVEWVSNATTFATLNF